MTNSNTLDKSFKEKSCQKNKCDCKKMKNIEVKKNQSKIFYQFLNTRNYTLKLVKDLSFEDMTVQSNFFTSPTKWHLAHTTWFFEKFILEKFVKNFKPFHPQFSDLFNSYYNTVGAQYPRHKRGLITKPGVEEVITYRHYVDKFVVDLLCAKKNYLEIETLVEIGIHHEQQHQELILSDIMNAFFLNPLKPSYSKKKNTSFPIIHNKSDWKILKKDEFEFGGSMDSFCYDNELPSSKKIIRPFKIMTNLVTNLDWKIFIEDKVYDRPEFWLSDGYDYIKRNKICKPLYWIDNEQLFTLNGIQQINDFSPVSNISYYEACAYARWKNKRLPTEYELEYLLSKLNLDGNFLENNNFEPLQNFSKDSVSQLYGDLWEWTSSNYTPYEGYKSWEGGLSEYNSKFMCNQFVLKGGSCITPKDHIRKSYRNFYFPHDRWQYSGFRLAESIHE